MTPYEIMIDFADKNNILVGFCDCKVICVSDLTPFQHTPFVKYGIDERFNPRLHMSDAQTIIVIGVSYNKIYSSTHSHTHGILSKSAAGLDYHIKVKKLLLDLANELKKYVCFNFQAYSDTGPLNERALAVKAGLGFVGRNSNIVSKKFGSYFHIGYLITDLELPKLLCNFGQNYAYTTSIISSDIAANDQSYAGMRKFCEACRLCENICPLGAITEHGCMNHEKCVSFLSQSSKELSEIEEKAFGSHLYGCDRCQDCCPFNKDVYAELIEDSNEIYLSLSEIDALTRKSFKENYKDSAFYWRGLKILKRNAEIVKRNHMNW